MLYIITDKERTPLEFSSDGQITINAENEHDAIYRYLKYLSVHDAIYNKYYTQDILSRRKVFTSKLKAGQYSVERGDGITILVVDTLEW